MRWDNDFLAEVKRQELEDFWKELKKDIPAFVICMLVIIIFLSKIH